MLPLAQSVAWLAVGVALGAAFRRTLPAIFTVLIGYGAAYLLVERAYPSFMAPVTALAPAAATSAPPTAGLAEPQLSGRYQQPARRPQPGLRRVRPPRQPRPAVAVPVRQRLAQRPANPCLAPQRHLMTLVRYQPASRIPDFHLILIGGYLGLGAVAAALLWWLVRRTSLSAG